MASRLPEPTAVSATIQQQSLVTTSTSHFDTLPPELRNEIYHLVLPAKITIKIIPKANHKRSFEHPLLRVNKQIRSEAMPIFYARNSISILAPFSGLRATLDWLRSVVAICGPNPFAKFRLGLGPTPAEYAGSEDSPTSLIDTITLCDKLPLLWPLLLFFYRSGLRVDYDIKAKKGYFGTPFPRDYEPYGYRNPALFARNDMRFCVTAIREMTELAVRARAEKWGQAKLREVFEAWVVWRRRHPSSKAWLNVRRGALRWMWKEDVGV